MTKPFIGMTERGDAGINHIWAEKIKNPNCAGAILITKAIWNKLFRQKALTALQLKPIIIHAGITGWGNTKMEPFVPKYENSIEAVRELIDSGFPADHIVLRVDPIYPTDEGIERATNVIKMAKAIIPDVKRIRISIYDDYHNAREEILRRGFPAIDSITKWKNETERRPTPEQVDRVAKALIAVRPDQVYECCAEPEIAKAYPDHFVWTGCLSKKDCDIMHITVPEGTTINNQQRFGCRCLSLKRELLSEKKRCAHNCAYCYWATKLNNE